MNYRAATAVSARSDRPGILVSVYDGGRCIGHVIDRGEASFEAFDTSDNPIGIFPTEDAAATALWRAARTGWIKLAEAAGPVLRRTLGADSTGGSR